MMEEQYEPISKNEETVDNYVKEMKSAAKSFNIQGSPLSISYGIST